MVEIVFYKDDKERCPVLEWLMELPKKIQAKAEVRIERLAELGYQLRRPEADYLRDEIYELRWRFQSVNYRILYFFNDRSAVVLAHGLTKEKEVPSRDIDLAVQRKDQFKSDPDKYTWEESTP